MELNEKERELLKKIKASKREKLVVFEHNPVFDILNKLWVAGYVHRAVSWLEKDYVFCLAKKAESII